MPRGFWDAFEEAAQRGIPYGARAYESAQARDARREAQDLELAGEGIFRGTAAPVSVDATVDEQPYTLPKRPDDSLTRSRARGRYMADETFADRADRAAREGRPRPPRTYPPGAFNPIRGTFEPATIMAPRVSSTVEVPNQAQLTDEFYVDYDRTPEARKADAEAERFDRAAEAGLVREDDRARADILGLGPTVEYRDEQATAATERDRQRAAWADYNERLQASGRRPVEFDPSINWSRESLSLERDLLNEDQIRSRPARPRASSGAGAGTGEPTMTGADARRFLNNTFGGRDARTEREMDASTILGSLEYERLAGALENGQISRETVYANQAQILAGKVDEVLAGLGTSAPERPVSDGGVNPSVLANHLLEAYRDRGGAAAAIADLEAEPDSLTATDHAVLEILRRYAR